MTEQEKSKRRPPPREGSPRLPEDPNDTGMFRWYQDLLDRILPKDKPPEK